MVLSIRELNTISIHGGLVKPQVSPQIFRECLVPDFNEIEEDSLMPDFTASDSFEEFLARPRIYDLRREINERKDIQLERITA